MNKQKKKKETNQGIMSAGLKTKHSGCIIIPQPSPRFYQTLPTNSQTKMSGEYGDSLRCSLSCSYNGMTKLGGFCIASVGSRLETHTHNPADGFLILRFGLSMFCISNFNN